MPKSTIDHLQKAVELQKKILDRPKPDRRELEEEVTPTRESERKSK